MQKPNGSHANGLSNVPFDGYRAELHRGEAVLTSTQASEYRNMGTAAGMAPLIKALQASNEALIIEVKGLRADAERQSTVSVVSNAVVTQQAAETVVAGTIQSATNAAWSAVNSKAKPV